MKILAGTLLGALSLLAQPAKPDRPELQQLSDSLNGKILFHAYCVSCHGEDGKGNGPAARALKTSPADLTRIAARNGGKFPSDRVQRIITGDTETGAAHGSREMPVWGPIFSQIAWDQDLGRIRTFNLAKYLEGIQAK